nr:prepilin peptidase [Clostridioides difficile]
MCIRDRAFICGGSVWLIVLLIEFIVKKECMGGGDIKLFAMIGLLSLIHI